MKNLIFTLFVFFISLSSKAQLFVEGEVIEIIKGDTFKLQTENSTLYSIVIANIDCPELEQSFGDKAKQFTSDAILKKNVRVEVIKKNPSGIIIGIVLYNGSTNLNQELLRNGLAWHNVKISNDSSLQALEDEAKRNKIGLWQDKNPVNPSEWLKANSVPPIYPGCVGRDFDAKRKCTADKISKFVNGKFDTRLAGRLGLNGLQRIMVMFKINKEGNIAEVVSKGPHAKLEQEAIRVINKLPKMKPGYVNGKPVVVPYTLPINFMVRK